MTPNAETPRLAATDNARLGETTASPITRKAHAVAEDIPDDSGVARLDPARERVGGQRDRDEHQQPSERLRSTGANEDNRSPGEQPERGGRGHRDEATRDAGENGRAQTPPDQVQQTDGSDPGGGGCGCARVRREGILGTPQPGAHR